MMSESFDELINTLKRLHSKTTPGVWETMRESNCPEPSHESIVDEKGRRILDCFNSEVAVIQEEHDEFGTSRWDGQGESDLMFVAAIKNAFPEIADRLQLQQDRQKILEDFGLLHDDGDED